MTKILVITAGGAIGTLLRYSLSGLIYRMSGTVFPLGTLIVNLSGSFTIGFFWGIFEAGSMSPLLRNFTFIGILGGFTTFSTFTIESFNLLRDGEVSLAFVNLFVSNAIGLLFVFFGYLLSRNLVNIIR